MRLAIDVESNSLDNPTKIWCIVTKDIDTGAVNVYRNLTEDAMEADKFRTVWNAASLLVGHNVLGWDFVHLGRLGLVDTGDVGHRTIDTFILSKLVDYPREDGHSIESYGKEFSFEKLEFSDFSKLSEEMITYCTRDVEISEKIFDKYKKIINDPKWQQSIKTEHEFQWLGVNSLQRNGFAFDTKKCAKLLEKVTKELEILDEEINKFPLVWKHIYTFVPKATKFGTIAQNSIPKAWRARCHELTVGQPCDHGEWISFNPASPKQVVDLLWKSGWQPIDRTKTSILVEREIDKSVREKTDQASIDLLKQKQEKFKYSGWKINENNLATLPATAPPAAKTLAKRILYEARRRTLTEWSNLVKDTGRIHGQFQGIGAWTHRMAHQKPNMANIPNPLDLSNKPRLLGAEMRSLFIAPPKRLLVGIDAAAIQLRIFAHYIDDAAFTKALVEGKKEDGSDPHSFNRDVIGPICKSRAAAKRFIFALLLGAGTGKLAEILECSLEQASAALQRIMERYVGFAYLKAFTIPRDAERGYFFGLDGRKVRIPGVSKRDRVHLAMSGYLQNGEAVIMKMATLLAIKELTKVLKPHQWMLVNLVHDEWQIECEYFMDTAILIAKTFDKALQDVGVMLQLKCPMAGSYMDDNNKYTIGTNWKLTH